MWLKAPCVHSATGVKGAVPAFASCVASALSLHFTDPASSPIDKILERLPRRCLEWSWHLVSTALGSHDFYQLLSLLLVIKIKLVTDDAPNFSRGR